MATMGERLSFLKQFLHKPTEVGSVVPSSRFLARALTRPFASAGPRADILELGAGTGAVTRRIAELLRSDDRLDICEANENLARHLKQHVLENGPLYKPFVEGRVRLFDHLIQDVEHLRQYDYIISGLPFTAFDIRDVAGILRIIRRHAKPGCVFSYFEYIGIRPVLATMRLGRKGKDFRRLSAFLSRQIANHQIRSDAVLRNFPPAHARHLRFQHVVV